MNQPPSTPQSAFAREAITPRLEKLAELVNAFQARTTRRNCILEPYAEHILTLRSKHASFTMIRDILDSIGIRVSAATISRFMRQQTPPNPKRLRHRAKSKRTVDAPAPPSSPTTPISKQSPAEAPTAPTLHRPRIANVTDL